MKSAASRYLAVFAVATILLMAGIAAINWKVDPLQFYRRATYAPEFADQARYQNPGLARNYPYDSVVAGTSVSLGFDMAVLQKRLGWNALTLAMSGASAHEQSLIMEVALRTGRVRHVLWDLNFEYLRGEPDWVSDYDGAFPAYFYDTNPWNEIPNYLLNIDTSKASLRVLLQRAGLHLYRPRSVIELGRLSGNHTPGRAVVWTSFERAHGTKSIFQQEPKAFDAAKLSASFEINYLRLIRAHPEVTFDLWFPPFSIARHALLAETAPHVWDEMFRWKHEVLSAVATLPNVRVHDFQGDPVVANLDHYVDTVHFDDTVRGQIVEAVAQGSGAMIVTAASLDEVEATLRREVNQFLGERAAEKRAESANVR